MHKKKRHCPASSGGSLTPFPGGGVHFRGHARLRLLAAGASRHWGRSLAPWGTWWPPFLSRGLGGGLATLWGVSPTFRLRGWDFGVIAHPLRSRGTSQPLFYGLIIAPGGGFVKSFFIFFFFFFLFPEGRGLVAPADGGYPPPLLPQCGIEGGETRQPVLPHTGFTGPQASEEVPMEPDVFNFHGSDLLCFTVIIIADPPGFVKTFLKFFWFPIPLRGTTGRLFFTSRPRGWPLVLCGVSCPRFPEGGPGGLPLLT